VSLPEDHDRNSVRVRGVPLPCGPLAPEIATTAWFDTLREVPKLAATTIARRAAPPDRGYRRGPECGGLRVAGMTAA
jgi:hypothetical protein